MLMDATTYKGECHGTWLTFAGVAGLTMMSIAATAPQMSHNARLFLYEVVCP